MGSVCANHKDIDIEATDNDDDLGAEGEFKSVHDLVPDCVLFGTTSPNDINQGCLGDCWLMSALASCAEYPAFVESLIDDNGDGTFAVHLYSYARQDTVNVSVSDTFPAAPEGACDPTTMEPVYMMYCHVTKEKEFWPCVLEKAFAKLAGGYPEIDGGLPVWAFGVLTGCTDLEIMQISDGSVIVASPEPPKSDTPHQWDVSGEVVDELDAEGLMDKLVEYDQAKYLMCCGSQAGSDSDTNADGVVQGHAYTILQAAKGPAGHDDINLVKLRNPWGQGEWTGDWSDNDAMWDQYPDVAAELGYNAGQDGAFWISIDDFVENYAQVGICKHSMQ